MNKEFAAAPWGLRVRLITIGLIVLLLVLPAPLMFAVVRTEPWVAVLASAVPAAIVGVSSLFVVSPENPRAFVNALNRRLRQPEDRS